MLKNQSKSRTRVVILIFFAIVALVVSSHLMRTLMMDYANIRLGDLLQQCLYESVLLEPDGEKYEKAEHVYEHPATLCTNVCIHELLPHVPVEVHPAAHYANMYIYTLLSQGLYIGIFDEPYGNIPLYLRRANVLEIRINTLEKLAEFESIAEHPLEMWQLDFMFLTNDIEDGSGLLRWGTFAPDSDGWVGHHTAWNDARTTLVFSREETETIYVGYVPWWFEHVYGTGETLEEVRRNTLIVWLAH